ncbi:hypothetical protein EDB83DRAFT_2461927 [Lactarius deliciosus]|nr:hypothetical protein EDB83DRAFT_2461927 [Lactarius deliciosus]
MPIRIPTASLIPSASVETFMSNKLYARPGEAQDSLETAGTVLRRRGCDDTMVKTMGVLRYYSTTSDEDGQKIFKRSCMNALINWRPVLTILWSFPTSLSPVYPMANIMAFIRAVVVILLAACAIAAPGSGVGFRGENFCV